MLVTTITPSLETTFNSQYAQLATSNVFAGFLQASDNGGPDTSAVLGIGVKGSTGVYGQSDTGNGLQGISEGPLDGNAGVFGLSSLSTSGTYGVEDGFQIAGVWGDTTGASSNFAAGVIGTADNADGGSFFNNSSTYAAVYGKNLGTGPGISGNASSSSIGVQGSAGTGVYGLSPKILLNGVNLPYGSGVHGVYVSPSAEGGGGLSSAAGVWADSSSADANALFATADQGVAGQFENTNADTFTVFIYNQGAPGNTSGGPLNASGASGGCSIDNSGNLSCTGTVSGVVPADQGAHRVETYSVQSAENWYEDAGTGQIALGAGHVDLEPVFGTTVNTGVEYHVFLTPKGDCKGLYVTNETAGGFDVRELGGGNSSIAFDYRIMAKRAGYEDLRLKDVTDNVMKQEEQRARMHHPGAAAPQIQHPPQQTLPGNPVRRVPQMRIMPPAVRPVANPIAVKPEEPR
jgi:hypothetical protein